MSNPTISQIKVGSTTYDIKDATILESIPYFSTEGNSLVVSDYFTVGADATVSNSNTLYFMVWGRLSHLNVTCSSKNSVTVASTETGNITDQKLLITKSNYDFLKPSTTVYCWDESGHMYQYSSAGNLLWARDQHVGQTLAAGTALHFTTTFMNQGYYHD